MTIADERSSRHATDEVLGLPTAFGRFDRIELERLGTPDAIEALSFEAIRAEMIEALGAPYDRLPLSDPMIKLIEVAAARELLLRQRVNDSVRACMLAFAGSKDLENLAALYGVDRRTIIEGNATTIPPELPELELDDELRGRTQLAPEGFSVAGPQGAYVFHGLEADPGVKDLTAVGPEVHGQEGRVKVYVLGRDDDGNADDDLVEAVQCHLQQSQVRPLTDFVEVFAAEVVRYAVVAKIITYPGPDPATVIAKGKTELEAFVTKHHRLGHDITDSGLKAALHQPGCQRVEIIEPASDLVMGYQQAPYCVEIELSHGGVAV